MRQNVRLPRRLFGLCVIATAVAVAALTASTSARAGQKVAVHQGIGAAALPGTAFGSTPADTPETVSFILKAQNLGDLQAQVNAGMPGGYLSVNAFARTYGQPQSTIAAIQAYLAQFHIQSRAMADHLVIQSTGTAGAYDAALGVQQENYSVPATAPHNGHPGRPAMTVHGATSNPHLPRNLADSVLSVLGLSNYPTFASDSVRRPSLGSAPTAVQLGNLTPADFARNYNLDPLYHAGATGAGSTIGIVTLASVDPSVPQYFWSNILGIPTKHNRISLVNVDGGAGPVSDGAGSGETTLDVEQSGALAPQANIVVYQAPNTDYGFVDGFFQAASDNRADSISASWGESETGIQAAVSAGLESPTYAVAFDEAYLESAAQGQSVFVSSGDYGAYTAAEDVGSTNLSAGNPDSSPWVTSAGGTTLPGTIPLGQDASGNPISATIPAERTWGWDWLWPFYGDFGASSEADFAAEEPIGSGGGFSVFEPTPPYQQGVPGTQSFSAVQYLTPTAPETGACGPYFPGCTLTVPTAWNFDPSPGVTTGSGTGRATPDVSADADPFTGYEEWYTFGDGPAVLEGGWGGTSFVAPQLNGSTALIDSALGRRVGFWNPAIYRFATQGNSPFTPLDESSTSNDNLYYTGTPGHVFNVGSGLGTPDLAKLATDFAASGR